MAGLIILIIVVIGIVVFYGARTQMQRVKQAWTSAARQLGMAIDPGSTFTQPKIQGTVDDLDVRVDTVTRGSGDSRATYTRYRVKYPSGGTHFELHRQSGFSKVSKFFGAQDVEIGDVRFDDTFVIKSDQPERVAAAITPTRRATILQLSSSYPGVEISDTKVHWEKRGVTTNAAEIVTVVRRLVGAAYVITGRDGSETALDDALRARLEGELGTSAKRAQEASDAFGGLLEIRRMEAETLAEAGDPKAADLLDRLAKELPEDEEIKGWQQRMATPQPAAAPPPESAEPVDAATIAADLFEESRLSFETRKVFDERYRGRPVKWTGNVRSTRDFRHDPKLGDDPGTRVVVTVATIENDLYGQTTVDAIVGLPRGNANVLRGRDQLTFEGKLTAIDAMARNLFVTEAKIL